MGILKSPLLSLGARGTIGDALTYQGKGQETIVRDKPIPTYRRTLPQLYQRWLYEDYAYLWRQQSLAIKQEYATAGSRYHLTGFQYWMKYHLTNLPDIAGWWKLDEKAGAIAYDSGRNANHGTIFGATPTTGVIDGAYDFDAINDYINCGNKPSLDCTTAITIEFFFTRLMAGAWSHLVTKGTDESYQVREDATGNLLWGFLGVDMAWYNVWTGVPLTNGTLFHLVGTFDGANVKAFIDGYQAGASTPCLTTIRPTANPVCIAWSHLLNPVRKPSGMWDNVIIYNRALDDAEILRHSLRRYPS